jgi:hypothetical protein
MQNPTTAQALLAGCWRIFEGQFFDIWDYPTMSAELTRQTMSTPL